MLELNLGYFWPLLILSIFYGEKISQIKKSAFPQFFQLTVNGKKCVKM